MHEERDSPRTVFHCVSCCWNVWWISCFLCSKENTSWQREWEEVFDEVRLLGPLHWASWRDWTWGETNQKQAKSFKGSTSLLYLVNHRGPVATRMLKTKKLSLGINVAENNPDWTGLPVADGGESFHGSKNHWSLLPYRRRRLKGCNSSLYHSFLLPNDGNGSNGLFTVAACCEITNIVGNPRQEIWKCFWSQIQVMKSKKSNVANGRWAKLHLGGGIKLVLAGQPMKLSEWHQRHRPPQMCTIPISTNL